MRARSAYFTRTRQTIVNIFVVIAVVASFLIIRVSSSGAEEIPEDPAAEVLQSMSLAGGGDVVGEEVLAALSVRSASLIGEGQLSTVSAEPTASVLIALDSEVVDADTNTDGGQAALADGIADILAKAPAGSISNVYQWEGVRGFGAEVSMEAVSALSTTDGVERINLDDDVSAELSLDRSLDLVDIDLVNDMGYRGQGIEVAVIDSGIDPLHSDLQHAIVSEACFAEGGAACPDGPSKATDGSGHGTMVAGIIASSGVRAPTGGTPEVGIHAIKVLDESGRATSSRYILDGINHVIDKLPNVAVVNISIGSYQQFPGDCDNATAYTELYADAINTLRKRGTTVVIAAGNAGDKEMMSAPACVASAISVGATYSSGIDGMSSSVCTDATTPVDKATCYSNASAGTDLFAPGTYVRTSYPQDRISRGSGTSFASPIVASCVAALVNINANATVDDIEQWIEDSTVRIMAGTREFPRLDCVGAARFALAATNGTASPTTPTSDPTPIATATPTPVSTEAAPTPTPVPAVTPDLSQLVATVTNSCLDENGRVDLSVHNPLSTEVNLSVDYTDLAPQLLHAGPGQTSSLTITGRPDGVHRLQAHVGDALIANELVRISCDPEVRFDQRCIGSNGAVTTTVTNRTEASAKYSVAVGTLSPLSVTLRPHEQRTLLRTGRPDGSLTVLVTRDGTEIARQDMTVDCDPDVEVAITNTCLAGRGRIDTSLYNVTGSSARYRVEVTGLADRSVTLAPNRRRNVAVTGRPDDYYRITVWRDELRVASKGITVSCSQSPAKTVVATTTCLSGNGRLDFRLGNVTNDTVTFTVKLPQLTPRVKTVAPNKTQRVTVTGRADGEYPVVITRDNLEVFNEKMVVNCD